MNLAVFGATGGVGRQVVTQALDAGHHVVAYVRNPSKLGVTHPNLTVVAGELTDRDAVQRAVHGSDAVISALGPSLDRKATGTPLVEGAQAIVDAMRAEGVERYIGMATPSLRDPRDGSSLLGRLVPFMGRTFLSRAYRELLAMSQIVTDSDLDWTIARFTRPTDGARTGTVRAGYLGRDTIGASIIDGGPPHLGRDRLPATLSRTTMRVRHKCRSRWSCTASRQQGSAEAFAVTRRCPRLNAL